jgi:formate hydrogenlyase subunit 3/multisubunit Na+/H+ antiporter MnhD subunit
MTLLLAALTVWLGGGALALTGGRRRSASLIGAAAAVIGSGLTGVAALRCLIFRHEASLDLPWSLPLGSLALGLDGLSAFFALIVALVCAPAAIYGVAYLQRDEGKRALGALWFFFNLLAAGMLAVVLARDGLLFLMAWEIMSLAAFFLVMYEGEKEEVTAAGWTYLVATHAGAAALATLFLLLGGPGESLGFANFAVPAPSVANACFILALVGFGSKMGLMPVHVWLPEAHPAAPSHVSAVMSGVMIKMGVYGLLRVLPMLYVPQFLSTYDAPPAWWGWTLLLVGAATGILGGLHALAQRDLKRLLAYSSVENMGIVAMGLGLGLFGLTMNRLETALPAFLGVLLHVLNHAVCKSLLFLGAGAAVHSAGTRNLEQLGGLLKRMGSAGTAMLIGGAAIAGLPPLNGFVGEFLIYQGAFIGIGAVGSGIAAIVVILALAMIGGLAAAMFVRTIGIGFLGEPRSVGAAQAHPVPGSMARTVSVLAGLCILLGVAAPVAGWLLLPVATEIMPSYFLLTDVAERAFMEQLVTTSLTWLAATGVGLWLAIAVLALFRRRLLARRQVTEAGTWDCGYARPDARMQYTGASFAAPIVELVRGLLPTRRKQRLPEALFPQQAGIETETGDLFTERLFRPLFALTAALANRVHWLQSGSNQRYVLYVALTILLLLVWKLGVAR